MHEYKLSLPPGRTRILVPGDIHFPVHDREVLPMVQEAAEVCGVTDVVLIGDTHDVFGLSTHSKPSARLFSMGRLQDEIAAGEPFLTWTSRFRTTTYIEGNHECRLRRLSELIPALDGVGFVDLLNLRRYEHMECMGDDTVVRVGPVNIEHGHHLRGSCSTHPGPAVLRNYPDQLTVFGHNHRLSMGWRTKPKYKHGKYYAAASVGHLSDTHAQFYASRPDWQQGFGVIDLWDGPEGEEMAQIHLVAVHRNRYGRPSFKMPGFGKVFR